MASSGGNIERTDTREAGAQGTRQPRGVTSARAALAPAALLRLLTLRLLTLGLLTLGLLAPAGALAAPDTIFGSATPATINSKDAHSVELGVKFSSEVAGEVTGVRFYKAPTNTGTHIGSLWTASGTLLASATFTNETESGWQQVNFATPVSIAPGTTYVAAYFAPKGDYSDTSSGFASGGVSSPPLSALASSVSPDGVYAYSTTQTFPTSSYKATDYWVDVDFEPAAVTPPGQVANVSASAGSGSATVTWSAPPSGGAPTRYTITPYIGATAQTPTTVTGSPPATSATIEGLTNGTAYTFTVQAANAAGAGPASAASNAVTPTTAPIAYPDLQLVMPTGEISVRQDGAARTLEFTHVTADLGAGPLEIRPAYDAKTGVSQGYQALYTMPSPGVWKFAYTVPIVGPMIWEPPVDYRFPLDSFKLYTVAPGGGIGTLVETSPKVLFCMTSDTYIGGVPNTPADNEFPGSACENPEGKLGLSVGWGDQYDATDGGEGIPISGLPSGAYWLQGEVDPDHYFEESNTANDLTDTKLEIEGDTVKVLEQTHPNSTPPAVMLTSPSENSTLNGAVTLSATASGPEPIASVQFLLDGEPIGEPVSTPPYTLEWNTGSTPPGSYYLSAQATTTGGFSGTASDTPVTIGEKSGEEGGGETPSVSIVNPVAGGTVSNTRQVSANVSSSATIREVQFYLDGKALGAPVTSAPYAISWNTTTASNGAHTLTAAATTTAGKTGTSAPVEVKVQNPAEEGPCFVMDVDSTVNGKGTVTTPTFTTAEPGEELVAFVSSDGPAGAKKQSATVSGAGLTWTLVARANARSGDAEIWAARASGSLANADVTSTPAVGGYNQSLTVISMQMSDGIGASATAGAAKGAPSVSLKTTEPESLVYAVGEDYTNAISRTLAPNQVLLRQDLDTVGGNTFWSQYTGAVTGAAGETVTLDDTAPAGDEWNMAEVEILGDDE
jgi:hypothetical protein